MSKLRARAEDIWGRATELAGSVTRELRQREGELEKRFWRTAESVSHRAVESIRRIDGAVIHSVTRLESYARRRAEPGPTDGPGTVPESGSGAREGSQPTASTANAA